MEVKLESRFKLDSETINMECPIISAEGCLMALVNLHEVICETLNEIDDEQLHNLYDIGFFLRYVAEQQEFISKEAQNHKETREIYIKEVIKSEVDEEIEYRDIEYDGDVFLCDIMVVTNCILYIMSDGKWELLESIIEALKKFKDDALLN